MVWRMAHPSHKSQLPRLRRAHGQVAGLIRMVEEERYCADILTQLRAAKSALKAVEQEILKTHVEHCVTDAIRNSESPDGETKLRELFEILKRFQD